VYIKVDSYIVKVSDVDVKYVILLIYSDKAHLYILRYVLVNACKFYGTMKM
jgi:hypothetical protein